jgi:hypothetical protein
VTIPPLQINSKVAKAVNQAKRLSQRSPRRMGVDVDLCATFASVDYSPLGLGAG